MSEISLSREQEKYVRLFQGTGENLPDLIDDILDISKIEAGQIDPNPPSKKKKNPVVLDASSR